MAIAWNAATGSCVATKHHLKDFSKIDVHCREVIYQQLPQDTNYKLPGTSDNSPIANISPETQAPATINH
jgi:hypothetical protein